MPKMCNVTSFETFLGILAFFVVLTSIVLALCIGLVLPNHWTSSHYVGKNSEKGKEELYAYCKCGHISYTSDILECIPHDIANRSLPESVSGRKCEPITRYPFLVSLNAPAYDDNKSERRLACTGVILSKHWVIVGLDCVHAREEWGYLRVRSGSPFWSRGGTQRGIEAASRYSPNGPMVIKVDPPFIFDERTMPIKVAGAKSSWTSAVSVGWLKHTSRKYDRFVTLKWSTSPGASGYCSVGVLEADIPCKVKEAGVPLIAGQNLLVGFQKGICSRQMDTNNDKRQHVFVDIEDQRFKSWFGFLLGGTQKDQYWMPSEAIGEAGVKLYEVDRRCFPQDQACEYYEDDEGEPPNPNPIPPGPIPTRPDPNPDPAHPPPGRPPPQLANPPSPLPTTSHSTDAPATTTTIIPNVSVSTPRTTDGRWFFPMEE